MAKLYSRAGAISHQDQEGVRYEPDEHGAFEFPDDLSDRLLSVHVRKRRMWENEEMRGERMHQESEARHRDPAVLYAAVSELVDISRRAQGAAAPAIPADLAAELADLRRQLAELRGDPDGGAEPGDDGAGAKPAGRRKAAAKPE